MASVESSGVAFEAVGNDVYEMRIERPDRMNALGVATLFAMRRAVEDARDKHARVLLVSGSGRAFCAGADLKERKSMDAAQRIAHNAAINDVVNGIGESRCVTIAVMNGLALGGGLELAMACDLRIAAAGISMGLTESRIGAFPGAGGTQRLPRLVGTSRALHMMLAGEPISSEHALQIGLVNEVVAAESLSQRAREIADLLSRRSAPALAEMKRLVYQGMELPLINGLRLERAALPAILGSADYAEGLAAFEERRQPRFTGQI